MKSIPEKKVVSSSAAPSHTFTPVQVSVCKPEWHLMVTITIVQLCSGFHHLSLRVVKEMCEMGMGAAWRHRVSEEEV